MKKTILSTVLLTAITSSAALALYGPNSVSASGDGSGTAYKVEIANNENVKEAIEILTGQKVEMSAELHQEISKEMLRIYIERNSATK